MVNFMKLNDEKFLKFHWDKFIVNRSATVLWQILMKIFLAERYVIESKVRFYMLWYIYE